MYVCRYAHSIKWMFECTLTQNKTAFQIYQTSANITTNFHLLHRPPLLNYFNSIHL